MLKTGVLHSHKSLIGLAGQGKQSELSSIRIVQSYKVFLFSDKTKPEIEFLPNQPKISDADITLLWKTTANKHARFECALDNVRNMRPCGDGTTGSWTDSRIPDGDHTLYVRARDSFGDYGQIKTHSWRVGKF
jgi:hypothetical protein